MWGGGSGMGGCRGGSGVGGGMMGLGWVGVGLLCGLSGWWGGMGLVEFDDATGAGRAHYDYHQRAIPLTSDLCALSVSLNIFFHRPRAFLTGPTGTKFLSLDRHTESKMEVPIAAAVVPALHPLLDGVRHAPGDTPLDGQLSSSTYRCYHLGQKPRSTTSHQPPFDRVVEVEE